MTTDYHTIINSRPFRGMVLWVRDVIPPPDYQVLVATSSDIREALDFDQAAPTWYSRSLGLAGQTIKGFSFVSSIESYIITDDSIWQCLRITQNTAIWKRVYQNAYDWNPMLGAAPTLTRIVARSDAVYALGWSTDGGSGAYIYLLKSLNQGADWTVYQAATLASVYSPYTLDPYLFTYPAGPVGNYTIAVTAIRRDGVETYNPHAIIYDVSWTTASAPSKKISVGEIGDPANSVVSSHGTPTASTHHFRLNPNSLMTAGDRTAVTNFLAPLFPDIEPTPTNVPMPKDAARTHFSFEVNIQAGATGGTFVGYLVWKGSNLDIKLAFDVGKHDSDVVYIGLPTKVIVTRDGGGTWADYVMTGANDIHCPAYSNPVDKDIVYWGVDRNLYWTTGLIGGLATNNAALLSEIYAENLPLRVGSDPDAGFPVFAMANQGVDYNLYKLAPGSSTLVTGITAPRSLRVYKSAGTRRIFYLDGSNIHYSINDGGTWSLKKGGWAAYANPVELEAEKGR